MTQRVLSRKARINVTRISFMENGIVDPEPEEQKRLAKALKASIADVFPEAMAS